MFDPERRIEILEEIRLNATIDEAADFRDDLTEIMQEKYAEQEGIDLEGLQGLFAEYATIKETEGFRDILNDILVEDLMARAVPRFPPSFEEDEMISDPATDQPSDNGEIHERLGPV